VIRRIIVIVAAWALRRGIPPADMLRALGQAFPHRSVAWRLDLLGDAIDRNQPAETIDAGLRAYHGAA
jgi:hypothetical protein